MYQLRRAALRRAGTRSERHGDRPVIERIAFWSASHAKTAVIGWFSLVGAAFLAGQLLGTQSLPQFDPGQAGQGERLLHPLNVTTPPAESVLIQPRGPGAYGRTFANDPQMRQAVRQVTAALDRLHSAAMDVSAPSLAMSRPTSNQMRLHVPGRRRERRSVLRALAPPPASFRPEGAAC
jgi:hypothetical protein